MNWLTKNSNRQYFIHFCQINQFIDCSPKEHRLINMIKINIVEKGILFSYKNFLRNFFFVDTRILINLIYIYFFTIMQNRQEWIECSYLKFWYLSKINLRWWFLSFMGIMFDTTHNYIVTYKRSQKD